MAVPKSKEARRFYVAAKKRFSDAELLLDSGRTTSAVYLAGYGVECMLKSLLLNATPEKKHAEVLATFRGGKAHDFDWLRERCREAGVAGMPLDIIRAFREINGWAIELRYSPKDWKTTDAERFLASALMVIEWIDVRI